MGCNYLVVDGRTSDVLSFTPAHWPNCVVVSLGQMTTAADVCIGDEAQLDQVTAAINAHPEAAATLVQLLRHNADSSILQGLFAESLAYSTLQQSQGFQSWLQNAEKPSPQADSDAPLLIERAPCEDGEQLHLIFNRPKVHNAYSEALKDALCEALQLAHADPQLKRVCLRGNGASFSAGGDLSEFGSVQDAALAHLSRTTRTAGYLLATLRCQTRTELHGACIGAGIELPAFTDHIKAKRDSFFQLPEVGMGLVPGAGGTVSISRRIGRQRTAWMALTGARVDADTALEWGLIDEFD